MKTTNWIKKRMGWIGVAACWWGLAGSAGAAGLLIADVSLQRGEAVRRVWPFLRDRRIDAYAELTRRFRD